MASTGVFTLFDSATLWAADGTALLSATNSVKMVLCDSGEGLTASNALVYGDLSNELPSGNGYVVGGVALNGFAITRSGSSTGWSFSGPTPKWAAVGTGIPAWRWFVLYVDATLNGQVKPLIGFALGDSGGGDVPLTAAGSSLDIFGPNMFSLSPPAPIPATGWVAHAMPPTTFGNVIGCDARYIDSTGYGGGKKHGTMTFCPVNNLLYVLGGDGGGCATYADKLAGPAAGKSSGVAADDFRNDIWSYDAATDNWQCVKGWDCPDGSLQVWRPDWGMFAWDSKRNVFWYRMGGSNGANNAPGLFAFSSSTGLQWTYLGGKLMPDITVVPGGTLNLTDNATNYVEYNPATHVVAKNTTGFTGGSILPLYQVVTSGGSVSSTTSYRPYYMNWGNYDDEFSDPRHYADPTHLVSVDPLTGLASDPGLARLEDAGFSLTTKIDGRVWITEWRSACMVYDPTGDQLIYVGASAGPTTCTFHYSFGTNAWSRYPQTTSTQLNQCRQVFVDADRKLYCVEGQGQNAPYRNNCLAWTYDADTHIWSSPFVIPGTQLGTALWTGGGATAGQTTGGMLSFALTALDEADTIIWFPETTNNALSPYGFGTDGYIYALHAWHYQENRWEIISPPNDATSITHGNQVAFDPVNKLLVMYGQDADPSSPVTRQCYVYSWTPSGFTKPMWSSMP